MIASGKPAPLKWLIRALSLGAGFLALMLAGLFGSFEKHDLLYGASGACLALCLVVAAVAFVLEVVRRTTGPS